MKTLIKVNNLELLRNCHELVLLESGEIIAKFLVGQLSLAVYTLISLTLVKKHKVSSAI